MLDAWLRTGLRTRVFGNPPRLHRLNTIENENGAETPWAVLGDEMKTMFGQT